MYTLLVTGDVPGAATYFNPLLQQSVIPCTSGTRPSSPVDGMMIYETDTRYYRSWSTALSQWVVVSSNGVHSFTPQLTAVGGGLNLGTGAVRRGQYMRGANGMVAYSFYFRVGSSSSAGSGQYLIDLPITCASAFGGTDPEWWGAGRVTDNGIAAWSSTFYIPGSNLAVCAILANGLVMGAGGPMTIASGDDITGTITYRAAAGS